MKRLVVFALLLPFCPFGACTSTSGECGPFKDKFKTTGFSTAVRQASFDSLRAQPDLSAIENDTLESGRFAVRMRPEKVLYSGRSPSPASFQVLPSAHACSPEIPTSDEVITDLRIYSDKDFTDEYAAGDNLAALFDVVVYREAQHEYRRFELPTFIERAPNAADKLILILNARPTTTSRFPFTIEYEQEGKGLDYYEFETAPVVLKSS